MKFLKKILLILVIFLDSGNIFSEENLFNVNNIEIVKKSNISNDELANKAIKLGFKELMDKILLKEDYIKISQMNFLEIKELVSFYQIINKDENKEFVNFNIFFDREKIHNLFYKKNIFYSDISYKELFLLPIYIKQEQIYIYNNNYFYENWNELKIDTLIEFILPLENIEVIQNINKNKDNILSLNLESLFKEYSNKNLALVIIEETNKKNVKVYLKTKISGKNIDKSLLLTNNELIDTDKYNDIIVQITNEITSLVKAQNLIMLELPHFFFPNARLLIDKKI